MEKMTVDEAIAVAHKWEVNHGEGKLTSPAIFRAADVLANEVERFRRTCPDSGLTCPRCEAELIILVEGLRCPNCEYRLPSED